MPGESETVVRLCRRLQARGCLVIDFDHPTRGGHKWWEPAGLGAGSVHVRWWPAGQRGNTFCGHGRETTIDGLPEVLADIEERSRPHWHDLDTLVWKRAEQWRHLDVVRSFIAAMAAL